MCPAGTHLGTPTDVPGQYLRDERTATRPAKWWLDIKTWLMLSSSGRRVRTANGEEGAHVLLINDIGESPPAGTLAALFGG